MLQRTSHHLLFVIAVLSLATLYCDIDGREAQQQIDQEAMTAIAREATQFAADATGTAQSADPPASLTDPPPTATNTPEGPFVLPGSANLPPAVFIATDPTGDAFICETNEIIDDTAVDIVSLGIYDPADLGLEPSNWLARIEMGFPADQTFANDWSAAVLLAGAAEGEEVYTLYINEIHDRQTRQGILDEIDDSLIPFTEEVTLIDNEGNIWFYVSRDTAFIQIVSFHLPSADIPIDEKRCDIAPDDGVFILDLPE